jgi:hypothetical protein
MRDIVGKGKIHANDVICRKLSLLMGFVFLVSMVELLSLFWWHGRIRQKRTVGIKDAYLNAVPKFLTKRSSKCARFSKQPWFAALASVF